MAHKAVQALAAHGLVVRRRKAGTFVAAPPGAEGGLAIPDIQAEIEARGQAHRWVRLSRRLRRAATADADEARLEPGAMLEIAGLHLADGLAFALETRVINLAEAPEAGEIEFQNETPGAWLSGHVAWTEARHQIAAVNPDLEESERLGIPSRRACLSLKRWTWREGAGITFACQLFPGPDFVLAATFRPGG